MLADNISLAVKKDPLICAFGSKFITTHNDKHHINVCSRKMRELAKVLIESKKIDRDIRNFFDLLQPKYFDVLVQSVKTIAKYDEETDSYHSPSFVISITRSLKNCCNIAELDIVNGKNHYENVASADVETKLAVFRSLLESMWKTQISL